MQDQAQILRELMNQRRSGDASRQGESSGSELLVIGVTSGNGGAGKTTVALNLALALQQKHRVCLWDISGTAALEILCDCTLLWNLSHVLEGTKKLPEVLAEGPQGLQLLAGPGLSMLRNRSGGPAECVSAILETLSERCDVLVLDLPAAANREVQCLLEICKATFLVTTPDPISVTAAYASIKSNQHAKWSLLVNKSDSLETSVRVLERFQETSRMFLQQPIEAAGQVPFDREIPHASRIRMPLMLFAPNSEGARAFGRLAERVEATTFRLQSQFGSIMKSA